MVLWETPHITSRELGQRLYLDSGTLTPLLKKLEDKGLLLRRRDKQDARQLYVELTPAGSELRERASAIPQQLRSCVDLNATEAAELKRLLEKLLATL